MKKYVYNKNNGLWYELHGEYYLPCLTSPTEKEKPIGIYGQQHLRYLKKYRRVVYTNLLTTGRLNAYLAEANEQAQSMFFRLVKQMSECEGITEQLKSENPMLWVGKMNNIRESATEGINKDLIYN